MSNNTGTSAVLRALLTRAHLPAAPAQKPAAVLDDAKPKSEGEGEDGAKKPDDEGDKVLDSSEASYASQDIAIKAAGAVQEWAETSEDDLDEGESYATRLMMLMIGLADADGNGEIGDAEQEFVSEALTAAGDYMIAKGVPEADVEALLNDWDDGTAESVRELLVSRLPDGEDASAEDIDAFAFGDGDGAQESMFDSVGEPILDAVYKKRTVIRAGRKVKINKRISGSVRLSSKQKLAVRKMLRKTHSAVAQMRRAKSVRVRNKMMPK